MLGSVGVESLTNFRFNLRAPWTACRICGVVYQTELDRKAYELCMANDSDYLATYEEAKAIRNEWRVNHESALHTEREIRLLNLSGLSVTPEAALALAPLGIIPIGDAGNVYISEVDEALFEAPRAPTNDVEGSGE